MKVKMKAGIIHTCALKIKRKYLLVMNCIGGGDDLFVRSIEKWYGKRSSIKSRNIRKYKHKDIKT